jgi:hypothetical protein
MSHMLTGFQTKKYEDLLDTMYAVDDWHGHPHRFRNIPSQFFFKNSNFVMKTDMMLACHKHTNENRLCLQRT